MFPMNRNRKYNNTSSEEMQEENRRFLVEFCEDIYLKTEPPAVRKPAGGQAQRKGQGKLCRLVQLTADGAEDRSEQEMD